MCSPFTRVKRHAAADVHVTAAENRLDALVRVRAKQEDAMTWHRSGAQRGLQAGRVLSR